MNVVTNMIMAGMSGSAIADAAGVGLVAINAMSKAGFDRAFSAGVSAAAATIGPIIPPSIPFVIFGCMTGVSVGRLFLGGFAPGLLMGLGLMITVYITSVRRGYPTQPRASFKAVMASLSGAWSAILAPVIVVGGILTGVFTPTEAAVAACFYAAFISMFVYRRSVSDGCWRSWRRRPTRRSTCSSSSRPRGSSAGC